MEMRPFSTSCSRNASDRRPTAGRIRLPRLCKALPVPVTSSPVSKLDRKVVKEHIQKQFDNKFDIIIAAGVFDYVSDPKAFLIKVKSILKEKAIFSFPVKWSIFTPLRMVWLHKKDCPSYYYSKGAIRKIAKVCGLKIDSIHRIGSFLVPGNYIVVCSEEEYCEK